MPLLRRLSRRLQTIRDFAATGQGASDRLALALAGIARHRPFGDDSMYARLGRWLTPRIPPRVKAAGGQRIAIDLTSLPETMIFEEIFVDRIYPLERVPFTPDLVIDCGAFCGMFSLLAYAHWPHARFLAIEPQPHNFSRVTGNFTLNRVPAQALAAAVGTRDGTTNFSGDGFGGHVTSEPDRGAITVRVVSLARLLRENKPHRLLLKLDVEGAEREVLPDILPLLPPDTVIFLETHHPEEESQGYLRPCLAAGFTHELIRNRLAPGEPTLFLERMLVRQSPGPARPAGSDPSCAGRDTIL